ncbi:hypothetical protein ACFQ38_09515 [Sporosarcina contaminans]|uniref:Transposase n=1 Tax=Sporosarcina contaminans TaxID=633403 RepID=A0ABW3U0W4_9BACL
MRKGLFIRPSYVVMRFDYENELFTAVMRRVDWFLFQVFITGSERKHKKD